MTVCDLSADLVTYQCAVDVTELSAACEVTLFPTHHEDVGTLSCPRPVPEPSHSRILGSMTDVRHMEQQDEKVSAVVAGPSYASDAQVEALLDKHMSRWSTLLDRLK